jgi:hypothetical protein
MNEESKRRTIRTGRWARPSRPRITTLLALLLLLAAAAAAPADDPLPVSSPALVLHPNPFSPHLAIEFSLAQPKNMRLDVFDLRGRRLDEIAAGDFKAGRHSMTWLAADEKGRPLPSGVYILKLGSEAGEVTAAKAVLLR